MKTSPQQSSPSRPAGDGNSEASRAQSPEHPQSPALSTTSTADCSLEDSPILHSLPAPTLPSRALELLRTPPALDSDDEPPYVTASWGSPYPQTHREHLREESLSSEASEDSPIHQLELHTPFLRPPPEFARELADQSNYAFVSAAVLANRARRPTRGLTEEWIRQHTADDSAEGRPWLSDGTEDSEPSSLRGSASSNIGWLEPYDLQTPRANPNRLPSREVSRRHPRARSSVETLTPESHARDTGSPRVIGKMATEADQTTAPVAVPETAAPAPVPKDGHLPPETPPRPTPTLAKEARTPKSPAKSTPLRLKSNEQPSQPRPKKKVPWKGKNIMVLLPLDDHRGQANQPPAPLTQGEVERMYRDWEELGYNVRGFDLNRDSSRPGEASQSRAFWPDHRDMEREHRNRHFVVTLPDLNGKW